MMKMPSGTRLNNQGQGSLGRSVHGPGPVMVEHKNMKFLITDRPNNASLSHYIEVSREFFCLECAPMLFSIIFQCNSLFFCLPASRN